MHFFSSALRKVHRSNKVRGEREIGENLVSTACMCGKEAASEATSAANAPPTAVVGLAFKVTLHSRVQIPAAGKRGLWPLVTEMAAVAATTTMAVALHGVVWPCCNAGVQTDALGCSGHLQYSARSPFLLLGSPPNKTSKLFKQFWNLTIFIATLNNEITFVKILKCENSLFWVSLNTSSKM